MTDPMTNPAYLAFVFFVPLLVALVKQSGFSQQVNSLIALGVYCVVGVAAAILSGQSLTADNLAPLIVTATLVGTAAYQLFWSKVGQLDNDGFGSIDDLVTELTSFKR